MPELRPVAFLTMQDISGFFSYDHLTIQPLIQLGWEVSMVPWDADNVDWNRFEAVVIRSPWDYHQSPTQFLDVLATIEASEARLLNSFEICRWNMDKTYLRELAENGVPTIPTRWLDRLEPTAILDLFRELDCEKIVVKPTIGAGASDTFVLSKSEQGTWTAAVEAFSKKPLLAQPFVESIVDEGEYSLFYFGGEFSHAILKKPKPNDFRVQEEHGGIIRIVSADQQMLSAGEAVLAAIGETLLYARVDFVKWQNQPALIELELIEPSLYFSYDNQSPTRFAKALDRMMQTV